MLRIDHLTSEGYLDIDTFISMSLTTYYLSTNLLSFDKLQCDYKRTMNLAYNAAVLRLFATSLASRLIRSFVYLL